jgi:hypothetical protein
VRELGVLPPAFETTGLDPLGFTRRRLRGLDRVRRCPEFVSRDVADRRGLRGGVRGMPWSPTQVSGSGVCMARGGSGHCPRDLAARPRSTEVDRPTWTVVLWPRLLEVGQHVLRAVSRPDRESTVIVVLEDAAATHGDEPWIPDLGKDHDGPLWLVSTKTIG